MIQIHIIVFETEKGTRFKVYEPVGVGAPSLRDVTESYTVAATVEEATGRKGFVVLRVPEPAGVGHGE